MKNVLVLFLLLVLIPVSYALVAYNANARMTLYTAVPDGGIATIERTILVKNVNDVPVIVTLEPDNHLAKIMQILDTGFVLQVNESKKAGFRMEIPSGGVYQGRIAVSFKPEDPDSKATPVGLATTIIVVANGTKTERYYEIMEDTADQVTQEENPPLTGDETPPEDSQNASVSVSIGNNPSDIQKDAAAGPNPAIGIAIIAILAIVGVGVFLLINKKSR